MLKEEADRLGVAIPCGIMVECPSAALLAPRFAAECDFFSIGTNDLTQYTLAMDRGHPRLAPKVDGLHPAVLKLVALVVEAAAPRALPVSVCGGLAADPAAVPILVGLGIRKLSVPAPAAQVKRSSARLRSGMRGARARRSTPRRPDRAPAPPPRRKVSRNDGFPQNAFSFLQKIGKSLMLPVSVLPIAASCSGSGAPGFSIRRSCRE
jgi:hypothetical protein